MQQYLDLLKRIKEEGTYKTPARENMPGTYSLFGEQMKFDLKDGFPILTTKKVSFKNIVTELLWFLRGNSNIEFLVNNGCNIWSEDAYNFYARKAKEANQYLMCYNDWKLKPLGVHLFTGYIMGDTGKQYPWLWRNWKGKSYMTTFEGESIIETETVDQIKNVIDSLRNTPDSRRHIICNWNPATLDDMALPACHDFVQFNCRLLNNWQQLSWLEKNGDFRNEMTKKDGDIPIISEWSGTTYFAQESDINRIPKYYLDCSFLMRSNDFILGNPYNVSSYAILTHLLCKICNMVPGVLTFFGNDVHIYENQLDAVEEQLTRTPSGLPKLVIDDSQWDTTYEEFGEFSSNDWTYFFTDIIQLSNFRLEGYNPQPAIKAQLSTGLIK